ncbi:MAG TPA: GMC family oxidoreductase N-terminal domain-containing protein [Xanthobacteraceae bacterium]|nr:GMC family oxidoreductase N-terminal domain-containing protein [Xanthobacteraceae bacterium]
MMSEVYDYIVVGGGSAGCAVTCRLIEAGKSVLLLEAGPKDNHPYIHIPATFIRVHGSARTWMYKSAPEPELNGREVYVPQGRTLGGGSSVNAMIYIRGQAEDYDDWRRAGCTGWGFDDVLPFFRRSEGNERLAGPLHGTDGPLKVSDGRHRHPLSAAFVKAAQEAGIPYNDDFNGAAQAGVGYFQTTTFAERRASSAATYLRSVRGNPRLTVVTNAHVLGLILENGAAVGVRTRHDNGQETQARVREEVILSAGALSTPKILMLSGIGPAAHLSELGIPVVRDLAGVGENFQDHLAASVYGQTRENISLLGNDKGLKALRHGLAYLAFRRGLLTSNVVESGGFVDTAGQGRPDIQFHVVPNLVGDVDRLAPAGHGISINPCDLRPKSRGTVRLGGRAPEAPIVLNARYLSAPEDLATLVRGVRLARRILRAPSLARLVSHEILPSREDEAPDHVIEDHVRTVAKTVYHPSGTCRMGTDELAVVDPALRVRGVPRLRVADISIMPSIVSGNTNAPAIMIGERCADFVLGGKVVAAPRA